MKTTQEKLQYIKSKVVEVCPEVMKKSFGCRIEYEGKKGVYIEHLKGFADTFKLDEQFKSTGMSIISNPKLKIIGHPITLSHILRTVDKKLDNKYWIGSDGHFWQINSNYGNSELAVMAIEGTGIYWNITKDLDGQDEKVLDFLYQLIK